MTPAYEKPRVAVLVQLSIAGGRRCGRGAAWALVEACAKLGAEIAAPPMVEAVEAIRFERRHRTPPPFANPAKLARTERRHGRPGR